jgi:dUTPase
MVYQVSLRNGMPVALSRYLKVTLWEGEQPITLIKPEQIVIAGATLHPLLIRRLDNNEKISIRGYNLAAEIDVMANQEMGVPQSGLTVKHGIDMGAGVIEEDYRSEIKVVLINNSIIPFPVKSGDRIRQLILKIILRADLKETKNLSEIIRGNQGFGSTGLEVILSTKIIASIKAMKFHSGFCQCIKSKAQQDNQYQLFLETKLEDNN